MLFRSDYSLAINAIEFTTVSYNANEQLMSAALTVRFRLYDIKNKTQAASIPVNVKQSIRGANTDAVSMELREKLANAAAQEIGRQTASTVVNAQMAREADVKAEARAEAGQKQYIVRVVGMGSINPENRSSKGNALVIREKKFEKSEPFSKNRVIVGHAPATSPNQHSLVPGTVAFFI